MSDMLASAISRERQIARARRHGIRIPRIAWTAAKRANISYALACALLMRESSGGSNVFGHDPTIFVGAGKVTRRKYRSYLAERRRTGRCQGVGPTQLTSAGLQDDADRIGGCWRPLKNCVIGFRFFAGLMHQYGSLWKAAYHYNGSGPLAERYANATVAAVASWQRILSGQLL